MKSRGMILTLLTCVSCSILIVALSADAGAEIYKWTDSQGTVHFTDTPPPAATGAEVVNPEPNRIEGYGKIAERKPVPAAAASVPATANRAGKGTLPKVEMFVTSWCGYCKKAEAYFRERNIPFVAYDIEKDPKAARRKAELTNSRGVPFVLIGDIGIPGYSEAEFDRALQKYR